MPASDYFTVTGGSYTSYNETPQYISFQLLGPVGSSITFKQNLTTYFTVIGGGGGGGGGGQAGDGSDDYMVAGGGGGAGASGKISFLTSNNVPYSYEVGSGGIGKNGNNSGISGEDTSVTFSATEKINASGGGGGIGFANGNGGGDGGTLTIQGVSTIINGTSGNGGHGFRGDGIESVHAPSAAFNGIGNNPISIEIYPGKSELVGGGGAGGTIGAEESIGAGGGGGNGNGGVVNLSPYPIGVSGVAYGGGGGGGGFSFISTSGGNGREGAIFVYILIPPVTTTCTWNPDLSGQSVNWSRANTAQGCVSVEPSKLDERRKAEIFKYKNNSANFSRKQNYARFARGFKQRGQTFATQTPDYTNSNIRELKLGGVNGPLLCKTGNTYIANSRQNNVPGPTTNIAYDPTVPLTRYVTRRTYSGGSEKWPQYGPNTGQARLAKWARNTGTKPGMFF
jgi:hypothetical protein